MILCRLKTEWAYEQMCYAVESTANELVSVSITDMTIPHPLSLWANVEGEKFIVTRYAT